VKIVIHGTIDSQFISELRDEFEDVDFVLTDDLESLQLHLKNAEVLYGVPDKESFASAEKLRWIANPAVGVDYLMKRPDIVESDVVLTNARAPGYEPHAEPLADHVIGMMLILAHRWIDLLANQRSREWGAGKYNNAFLETNGTTMGIFAVGAIGSAVARRAAGFGMDVYAVDKKTDFVPEGVKEVWGPERLDELISISDWFVVAAPLTIETNGLIDDRRLGLMKKGAHLIVISRGNIVDEKALIEKLRSGHISGAGLDVFAEEPLPSDSPFWDQKNVLITPHTAHVTPEMPKGHREVFRENLRLFLSNKPFLYVCDKQAGY
tara:strand:- start:14468 stop:15433 length:966 start_codon:yes stop_codon:yes gene_type:complete